MTSTPRAASLRSSCRLYSRTRQPARSKAMRECVPIFPEAPRISIDIVPDDQTSNLHFREADIALRMYRPTQLELTCQKLGELAVGAFASRGYLERRGCPRTLAELLEHDVVGMDRDSTIIDGFAAAGIQLQRDWFGVRCDHSETQWALVRAGCGIGFGQVSIARQFPEVVPIPLELGLPTYPVWLTAHEAVRSVPRVAYVWDFLARELGRVCKTS